MKNLIKKFATDNGGNIAMIFAVVAVPLMMVAGAAVDYSTFYNIKSYYQQQMDVIALEAAQEFIEKDELSEGQLDREITSFLDARLKYLTTTSSENQNVEFQYDVDHNKKSVTINARITYDTGLMKLAGVNQMVSEFESVTIATIDRAPVCILALSKNNGTGIEFSGDGELKAKDCVVWSNATGILSVKFYGNGKVKSEKLCAVGRSGPVGQYKVTPEPESGCRIVTDPLASWKPPYIGECDYSNLGWITKSTSVLKPGVYCGGLQVDADKIKLQPGIFIIKDGPLVLRGGSEIKGKNVGIFLTGVNTYVDIDGKSKVDIRSAETGPMAGIAIAGKGQYGTSNVTGRSNRKIGGVIYLPNQALNYVGESEIEAISPVTTIIANTIKIGGETFLEVRNNKDKAKYAPVINTGGSVRLVK